MKYLMSSDKLCETVQLAEKIYGKTGILQPYQMEVVINVTGGDNYTKFIADVLHDNPFYSTGNLREIYELVSDYDKRVIPVVGLEDVNKVGDVNKVVRSLQKRKKAVNMFRKLPSIAKRNIREEIRTPMELGEVMAVAESLEYLVECIGFLENRPENIRNKFFRKLFKKGQTIDEMVKMVEDKKGLIGGIPMSPLKLRTLASEHPDLELVYDEGSIMVFEVSDIDGIHEIGKNSLWCFTYGKNHKTWSHHSTNEIVYVIFNFNIDTDDPYHMLVLISPLDGDEDILFDMMNDSVHNEIEYLEMLIPEKNLEELFSFEMD